MGVGWASDELHTATPLAAETTTHGISWISFLRNKQLVCETNSNVDSSFKSQRLAASLRHRGWLHSHAYAMGCAIRARCRNLRGKIKMQVARRELEYVHWEDDLRTESCTEPQLPRENKNAGRET